MPPAKDDIRGRAIAYARSVDIHPDVIAAVAPGAFAQAATQIASGVPVAQAIMDMGRFAIGIHAMVASAFEVGYAARMDDERPARALVDAMRKKRVNPRMGKK